MALRYFLRRLLRMIPVILGMTIIVFFMIHLVPGDPARTLLGPRAPAEAIEAFNLRWGFDRPLHEQFLSFLGGLFQGDLGTSMSYNVPTTELVSGRFTPTLLLLGISALFAMIISLPLAVVAALREERTPDHVVRVIPMVGLGLPAFWVGILLLTFVALNVDWLPVGGYGATWPDRLIAMILPGLTVAIGIAPFTIRSLRSSLIEVMEADYIATARAKGLAGVRVLWAHGLRNAVIPTVTVLGVNLGWLVGNTLIVEKVFALPGLGALMIDAVLERDFAVVQGMALIFGLLVVLVNLLADVVRASLDPRVQLS
ncbi:MAG: ABC transporter permease [bacterium]|nr:ABC transporter permease [bacterium]MDE0232869.1 ABC transporter permease [bacterium]MDE0600487.1 ABC transporter permease [bacterium]